MIRYEVQTASSHFVMCDSTLQEAKDYIQSLIDEGVEVVSVSSYDRDVRVDNIRHGDYRDDSIGLIERECFNHG